MKNDLSTYEYKLSNFTFEHDESIDSEVDKIKKDIDVYRYVNQVLEYVNNSEPLSLVELNNVYSSTNLTFNKFFIPYNKLVSFIKVIQKNYPKNKRGVLIKSGEGETTLMKVNLDNYSDDELFKLGSTLSIFFRSLSNKYIFIKPQILIYSEKLSINEIFSLLGSLKAFSVNLCSLGKTNLFFQSKKNGLDPFPINYYEDILNQPEHQEFKLILSKGNENWFTLYKYIIKDPNPIDFNHLPDRFTLPSFK